MAASSKPYKRDRAPGNAKLVPDLNTEMDAVFTFWDAVIANSIRAKSKRQPARYRIERWRGAVRYEIVATLLIDLRNLEEEYGKPYRDWSESERREAAKFITNLYVRRREQVQRGRGRPKKKLQLRSGLIASEMLAPEEQLKRARMAFRAKRQTLVNFVRGFKLGTHANEMEFKSGTTLQDVEQRVEKVHRGNEHVELSVSTAKAVRDALEEYGFDSSFAKALEKHLSRLKHSARSGR